MEPGSACGDHPVSTVTFSTMKQVTEHQVKLRPPQAVTATTLRLWHPHEPRRDAAVLLAPGAGSALDERVLVTVADGLAQRGVAAATFNFAYREAGRRPPDRADRLVRAFADALDAFAAATASSHTVVGGRSLGGRMATMLVAQGLGDGAVAMGYPLCPGGRPEPDPRRTTHWPQIAVPVLFIHGDRDRLCPVGALDRALLAQFDDVQANAHVVAGADHGFGVRVRDDRTQAEIDAELVDTIDSWLCTTFAEDDDD